MRGSLLSKHLAKQIWGYCQLFGFGFNTNMESLYLKSKME